jgi:hypothetical protein
MIINSTDPNASITPEKKRNIFKPSEGLMLAALTASGYLFAFYYEKGFAGYFRIPASFINVSLSNILIFGSAFVGFLIFMFFIINYGIMLFPWHLNPVLQSRMYSLFALIIVDIAFIYFFGIANIQQWIIPVISTLIIGAIEFGLPLITQRGQRSYIDKLAAQDVTDKQHVTGLEFLARRVGIVPHLFLLYILIGVASSESMGNGEALKQTEYLVTNNNEVVLRIYGDTAIIAPFDRTTKEVNTTFTLIKLATDSNAQFSLEKLGTLHPQDVPSALPASPTSTSIPPVATFTATP